MLHRLTRPNAPDLALNTDNSLQARHTRTPGAVVEIVGAVGRADPLTPEQARLLALKDFNTHKGSGCLNCFLHGKRAESCGKLCCDIRAVGLERGVEVSPYVSAAPEQAEEEEPVVPGWMMRIGTAWILLALLLRGWMWVPTVGAIAGRLLLLLVRARIEERTG